MTNGLFSSCAIDMWSVWVSVCVLGTMVISGLLRISLIVSVWLCMGGWSRLRLSVLLCRCFICVGVSSLLCRLSSMLGRVLRSVVVIWGRSV